MTHPKIQGNDIFELVEGLHAYDDGATDSGIRNETATREIDRYLKSLDDDARRAGRKSVRLSWDLGESEALDFGSHVQDNNGPWVPQDC